MIEKFFKKSPYLSTMLAIAIPVSIQSLFQASLSVIDQAMVGQLGENAIAAVGLGSRFPNIFIITLNAIGASTSIMVSQFWGKKDKENIARSFGGNLFIGLLITLIFSLLSFGFPNQVLSWYTKDAKVIELGSEYLKTIAVGYIPILLITMYSSILRSTEHVKLPMFAGIFGILMNTLLNYILIFGKFGFGAMGLQGTAYATTITRLLEALILFTCIYAKKYPGAFKIKEIFNLSAEFIKKIIIISTPILINEFLWAVGETMYSIVYGRMGTDEVAAMTLTFPIQSLSIGLFSGVSVAAGIMIGNKLGKNENEEAFKYSRKFIKLGIVGAAIFGIVLIMLSKLYVVIFNISNDLKDCTIKILIMFALVLWIKVSNMIIGGGILRSGGQTKYTLYLDMFGTWGIGVPFGFISAFIFKLPIEWVYLIISSEELARLIIGLKFMYSKKWMANITQNNTGECSINK
ncbi:MATE family efflux transporter [Clostridium saccharoperbutylacetonicum]|uniref:MATE family efflux transporter n=1 Tax=Clostridium saccharoperbutylacetonicum TaxID=36745 RepID=UPI000984072E|nr:MATE family efflux transporter [Clostridium saccharoperbutylacetonicum]AQR94674.1 multidrug resistance protein MdtK [Clostridium saccharoperbutylacetonicum]NSB30515.1 putative MATE family efflux protein [Clostridium saccharoperbutylacetonicum]